MKFRLDNRRVTIGQPSSLDIFSPVSGYDASDLSSLTLNVNVASNWANKGTLGSSHNLGQGTVGRQPLSGSNTQNGLNLLTFDGSNDQMFCPQINSVTHIFVASAWSASGAVSTNNKGFLSSNAYDWHGDGNTALVGTQYSASWTKTQPGVSRSELNGSNFINAVNPKWAFFSIWSINLNSGSTGGFSGTGTANGDGRQFQGDYGEIIVYQTTYLSTDQINTITGYLAHKWGTQSLLPSNHPYKQDSPFLLDLVSPFSVKSVRPTPTTISSIKISPSRIVTEGLVLNLDAGYRASYPGSGTTWSDISGSGNNGTLTNGPTYSSANGGSIVFDGSNDYVSANVGTTLDIGTSTSVTFSAWIKYTTSASNYTGIIAKATSPGGSNTGFQMLLYTNKLSCELGAGGSAFLGPPSFIGTTTLNTGNWFNTVLTINRSTNTVSIYVNGTLEASQVNASIGTSNLTSSSNLLIGTERTSGIFLNGNIAQVSVYNRALSADEIQQNYNVLRSRFGI